MISAFFINRPIFASVVSIVIIIIGGITIPFLPIENVPDITPPTVSVSTRYPGASAQVIADTVTTRIEEQINGVEDMLYMTSKSSDDGSMDLTVTFEVGTDIDMATVLVQNRVAIAEPMLPEEVKREGVTVQKKSTNIILMVALTSPDERFDEIYLSNYITTRIKDVLARVPGVGMVQIFGAKDFGMRIWLDPEKLAARNLTTMDVFDALKEQNVQVPAGQIGGQPAPDTLNFQYTIKTEGRLTDVEQFENIVVKTGEDGRLLRIKDVARVELGAQDYKWFVELNDAPAIAMGIFQQPGANALEIAERIRGEMDRLAMDFPEGMEYTVPYDTTAFIDASIKEVVETLFIALLLVVLTVYIFLQDIRTTLIPSLTIPVSLIGTFAVMSALGLSINTLTLFGLVLAIGIVVDDSILVVENTMRIIDTEKLDRKKATLKSMEEVSGPIIATTLVLLAVFVPTAMMGGITGRLYQQFALTIATATVFSSVNALTLAPALCGMLLRPTPEKQGLFFRIYNKLFDHTTSGYMAVVKVVVRRTAMAAILFIGLLVLTGFGMKIVPAGFLPDEDQGYLMIQTKLPEGASINRTSEVMKRIQEILDDTPGVSNNLAIFGYSIMDQVVMPNAGCFFITLHPWGDREDPQTQIGAIIGSVQQRITGIQEGLSFAFLPPPIQGLGNATGFEMQLQDRGGAGLNLLETIGMDLVMAGFQDPALTRMNSNFQANTPQLFLDIDRVRAKRLGVPLQNLFNTLQVFLGSAYVNDFNIFGRAFRVILQADAQFRIKVEDIKDLKVRNRDGKMIPLGTLLTVDETVGPQFITRHNLYPASTITGQGKPGFSSGESIAAVERIAGERLPSSMGFEWTGVTYQQIKAGNQAPIIFALAIVFVFLFLAAQYESWSIPMAVILSVPLAILGAMAGTFARMLDNNIYTQIGLVLLIGLASKSAIMIVEFAKQRRAEGLSVNEAAIEASRLRFRPILMTAFSFILGVLPLVIASGAGASARQSLGTAVFAGMIASTVFGVVFIPMLYVVVQRVSERLRGIKE